MAPTEASDPARPSARLYASLHDGILRGEFAPGAALKPQQLADANGVSLAVAREALLRLVGEGLAVRLPNRGFAVPAVDEHRWQEIAQARAVTEPAVLRLSIALGGVDWEARVRSAHHVLARTPMWADEGEMVVAQAWAEAHQAFHRALLEGCGNALLLDMFDRLWVAGELARRWSGTLGPRRDAAAEHAALERATLDRDADLAADLLARHVSLTAEILADLHRDRP